MFKIFSVIIFLFLSIPVSFAQSQDPWFSKVYSGYFQQDSMKGQGSFWHSLFGKKSAKPKEDVTGKQCSIEFKSPVSFTDQWVAQVPGKLTYFIRFKGSPAFDKFFIKIYTNDDQEYSIDPNEEGKQIGVSEEHHIFDSFLIYLILGHDIDHIEVISASGDDKDKYVLDKLEIQND